MYIRREIAGGRGQRRDNSLREIDVRRTKTKNGGHVGLGSVKSWRRLKDGSLVQAPAHEGLAKGVRRRKKLGKDPPRRVALTVCVNR